MATNSNVKNFFRAIMYFGAALLFVMSAVWGSQLITKTNQPVSTPTPTAQVYQAVTCPNSYSSYQSLSGDQSHVVKLLAQSVNTYAKNGHLGVETVITKNETQESKIACGYLYIRAGTKNHGPLQSWEYIYINPDSFGGHLNKENSFGRGDSQDFSEYIYELGKIQYWESNKNLAKDSLRKADWTALLNASDRVRFNIAFNTQDTTAWIYDVSIAYKCWNPNTGQENNGCKLNVSSSNNAPFSF